MWIVLFKNKSKKPIAATDNFYQAIRYIQLNLNNMNDIQVKYNAKEELFKWYIKIPKK